MEMFNKISAKFRSNESIQVQELVNEEQTEEDNYLKNTSANRSQTDVLFLVIQGVFLVGLAILLGYAAFTGDIDRLTKGYDDCGNVCGKNNYFYIRDQMECKSQDMTHKPYLLLDHGHRQCVENCDNTDGYHCNTENIKHGFERDEEERVTTFIKGAFRCLYNTSYAIASVAVIALVIGFLILLLLRYATAVFVWFTLFGMVFVFVAAAVYCGNFSSSEESVSRTADSVRSSIVFGIMAAVMLIVIFVLRKYIELLIQLFKEAGKCIISMPILLFEPILTFVSLAVIWSAFIYFAVLIECMGTAEELYGKVIFMKGAFLYLAELYNIFVMLWMVQFVCACQYMIVAGSVSSWYFTRNKNKLDKPICTSAKNLIKYHLGTVSVTSLIIAVLHFVKVLIVMLRRTLRFATCITYCLNYVEQWMRYYTKNACIITAMHGYSFREAGSRAFKLIVDNIIQIVTINSVGDWVLTFAKVLVAAITLAIGHAMVNIKADMGYEGVFLFVILIMSAMIAHCFFSVYEAAIDTIFICFCEDREINDGISRPYFMSTDLMAFIEKSKTFVKVKNANNSVIAA